ncbi:MAG: hypothetical protein QMD17_14720, partial [Rhodocyclaceae bacterium]|nr:hypothetical protein [Rhodocyclaceae bacterium]
DLALVWDPAHLRTVSATELALKHVGRPLVGWIRRDIAHCLPSHISLRPPQLLPRKPPHSLP